MADKSCPGDAATPSQVQALADEYQTASTTLLKLGRHDLRARTEHALAGGLSLRKRTAEHLCNLSIGREYFVSRYAPELVETMSQTNRLAATLEEVANKVSKADAIAR